MTIEERIESCRDRIQTLRVQAATAVQAQAAILAEAAQMGITVPEGGDLVAVLTAAEEAAAQAHHTAAEVLAQEVQALEAKVQEVESRTA